MAAGAPRSDLESVCGHRVRKFTPSHAKAGLTPREAPPSASGHQPPADPGRPQPNPGSPQPNPGSPQPA